MLYIISEDILRLSVVVDHVNRVSFCASWQKGPHKEGITENVPNKKTLQQ